MRTFEEVTADTIRHMENQTLERGDRGGSCPVTSYLEAELFEREMARVLRKRPLPLVPSERIRNPGDFITAEICGIPVIAVRDQSGKVRVYPNVCRHRGARLVHEETGKGCNRFICSFHGWTYLLTGEVEQIPADKNCFANASGKGFQLRELPSREFAGMIWVILDGTVSEAEIDGNLAQMIDDLPELGLVPALPFRESTRICSFNWKIGVEAFLEVYHFAYAHAPYLSDLEFPNLSLADPKAENCRIVVPLQKPAPKQPILEWAQVMYFVFPSTFLLYYDDHVALITLTPISVGETSFRYIPMVPTRESMTSQEIKERTDFLEVIISQDIAILEGIQKGLSSGANNRFTFTQIESLLSKFHQDLDGLRDG